MSTRTNADLERLKRDNFHYNYRAPTLPLGELTLKLSQVERALQGFHLQTTRTSDIFRTAQSSFERALSGSPSSSALQLALTGLEVASIDLPYTGVSSLVNGLKQAKAQPGLRNSVFTKWGAKIGGSSSHNPVEHFKPVTQKEAGRFVREFGINTVHGVAKNLEILGDIAAAPFKLWYDIVLKDDIELLKTFCKISPEAQKRVAEAKSSIGSTATSVDTTLSETIPGYSWAKEKTKSGVATLEEWHRGFNASVDKLADEYHRDYDIPKETTLQLKTDVPETVIGLGLFLLPSLCKRGVKLSSNTSLQNHFHASKVTFPAGEAGVGEAMFRMHAAPQGEALIFASLSAEGATAQESLRGAVGILERELHYVYSKFPEIGKMKLSMSIAEDGSQFVLRMHKPSLPIHEVRGVAPLALPEKIPAHFLPETSTALEKSIATSRAVPQATPEWLLFVTNGVGKRQIGRGPVPPIGRVAVSGVLVGSGGEIFQPRASTPISSATPKQPTLVPETPVELALEQYGALGIEGMRFRAPHEPVQGVTLVELTEKVAQAPLHSAERQVALMELRMILRDIIGPSLAQLHNRQPFHYLPQTAASIQADVAQFRQVTAGIDSSLLDLSTEELLSRFNPEYLKRAERRFQEADNVASLQLGNANPEQIRYVDGHVILEDPRPLAASIGPNGQPLVTRSKDLAQYRIACAKMAHRLLDSVERRILDLELVRGYSETFTGEFIPEADEFYMVQRPYALLDARSSSAPPTRPTAPATPVEPPRMVETSATTSSSWRQETYRMMDPDIPHEHGTGLALFSYAMREDGTMGCFIDYVLAIQNSSLERFPATPTLSTLFATLQALGRSNGAKKILIQFFPANKRLESGVRRYMKHVGEEKFFFSWLTKEERRNYYTYATEPLEMLELPCPVFELPMKREGLLNSLGPQTTATTAAAVGATVVALSGCSDEWTPEFHEEARVELMEAERAFLTEHNLKPLKKFVETYFYGEGERANFVRSDFSPRLYARRTTRVVSEELKLKTVIVDLPGHWPHPTPWENSRPYFQYPTEVKLLVGNKVPAYAVTVTESELKRILQRGQTSEPLVFETRLSQENRDKITLYIDQHFDFSSLPLNVSSIGERATISALFAPGTDLSSEMIVGVGVPEEWTERGELGLKERLPLLRNISVGKNALWDEALAVREEKLFGSTVPVIWFKDPFKPIPDIMY